MAGKSSISNHWTILSSLSNSSWQTLKLIKEVDLFKTPTPWAWTCKEDSTLPQMPLFNSNLKLFKYTSKTLDQHRIMDHPQWTRWNRMEIKEIIAEKLYRYYNKVKLIKLFHTIRGRNRMYSNWAVINKITHWENTMDLNQNNL
jgi:hypothetical protein